MSWESLSRPVDNSRVVRAVDPRSNRDLWSLLLLVAALVAALALYAWPHYEIRQTGRASQRMQRERERLLEDNRKLRLEKAALEDLRRVETIATRDLKLRPPAPQRLVVVEVPEGKPVDVKLASTRGAARGEEN
jgi:cell division protein FtsL